MEKDTNKPTQKSQSNDAKTDAKTTRKSTARTTKASAAKQIVYDEQSITSLKGARSCPTPSMRRARDTATA